MNCPTCDVGIDEHDASPCLDAWVAELIMGQVPGKDFGVASGHSWKALGNDATKPNLWACEDSESYHHGPMCTRCYLDLDYVNGDMDTFDETAPDLFKELDRIAPEACDDEPMNYSTNIAAAFQVLEKFNSYTLKKSRYHPTHLYACEVIRYKPEAFGTCYAPTPALAICKASLKAILAS